MQTRQGARAPGPSNPAGASGGAPSPRPSTAGAPLLHSHHARIAHPRPPLRPAHTNVHTHPLPSRSSPAHASAHSSRGHLRSESLCAPTGGSQSTCLNGPGSGPSPLATPPPARTHTLTAINALSRSTVAPVDISSALAPSTATERAALPSAATATLAHPMRRSAGVSDLAAARQGRLLQPQPLPRELPAALDELLEHTRDMDMEPLLAPSDCQRSRESDRRMRDEMEERLAVQRPVWTALDPMLRPPRLASSEMPTTVTQRSPYAGMLEWCVPHVPRLLAGAGPPTLVSPVFVSHGQAWTLSLFPGGVEATDDEGHLSLFLTLHPPPIAASAGGPNPPTHENRITLLAINNVPVLPPAVAAPVVVPVNPPPPPPPTSGVAPPPAAPAPVIAPPFVCAASCSSGRLAVRPEFWFTLIHPSGDERLNWAVHSHARGSSSEPMDFVDTHSPSPGLSSTFGLARFISHRSLHARGFMDSDGQILLRCEMVNSRSYSWSLAMAQANPVLARTTITSSAGSGPQQQTTRSSQPPQPSHSSSTFSSLARSIGRVTNSSSQSNSSGQVGVIRRPSEVLNSANPNLVNSHVDSFVTSSHIMFDGYEFALRLRTTHVPQPGSNRLGTASLALVLHPRHYYRLREDLALKLDLKLVMRPSHSLVVADARHNTNVTFRASASFHANTPEFEWTNIAIQLHTALINQHISSSLLSYTHLHSDVSLYSLGLVWSLGGFNTMTAARKTSGIFRLHDFAWNLIVDPKGNGEPGFLSVYLALDKTAAGVFCHGLSLAPVFTIAILHPTDPSCHIARRFEDAIFTFERASWGCTSFVELDFLRDRGYLTGGIGPNGIPAGTLQLEVQVQEAQVQRPDHLCVLTKIGPSQDAHADCQPQSGAQQLDADGDHRFQLADDMHLHDSKHMRHAGPGSADSFESTPKPRLLYTPSSPERHPRVHSSSSSPPFAPAVVNSRGNGGSPNSYSSVSSSSVSSYSPPVTPVLEYLFEIDDDDSYHLAVQSRRFGGRGSGGSRSVASAAAPEVSHSSDSSWSNLEGMSLTGDGRSNVAFMYEGDGGGGNSGHSSRVMLPDRTPVSPPPLALPPPMQQQQHSHPQSHSLSQSLSHSSRAFPPPLSHPLTSTTRHGYVCVIRNSLFTDPKLPALIGYEVDEDRLLNTFLHALHCDVETHLNVPGCEMQRVFRSLSLKDYSAYDYLMIFVLTHGVDSNTVYAADGAHLTINDVFCMFRGVEAKTLAGKPKLFFVQACRGNCVDYSAREGSGIPNLNPVATATTPAPAPAPGTSTPTPTPAPPAPTPLPPAASSTTTHVLSPPPPSPPITITRSPSCGSLPLGHGDIPNESDFLYASSCVPGYISWTNTASGSWYITALCNVLLSYWPTMHLGDILLRVNYAVSKQNKLVEKYGSVYQIAAPAFTLTRKMFFVRQQHARDDERLRDAANNQDQTAASTRAMRAASWT